ncbi:hypothetical protein NEMBOFW57_009004 [Staphylotrichum longicolle]|uniref:Uncharacterized protein n=1 Tax=Staphylotrichum longicolle TaxID=669026 RepID=A0AAD4ESC6_9PEZI|nr:hypothetical protein NEMBOFW57_009004 [Staphylotrichum longicolle]
MPAKRSAASAPSRAKKRPSTDAEDGPNTSDTSVTNEAHPPIPRSKRWAPVSGSANADMATRWRRRNPNKKPKNSGKLKRGKCDAARHASATSPSEHPDHIWKLSAAGKDKFFTQRIYVSLRSPDNFGMYTFNDHEGYGVLEVLQNLILDFEEAAGNYKEQWAVCEALAFFLSDESSGIVTQIDDGEGVDAIYQLIGRLFMSILAQLEQEKLLAKDSEIKSLGLIMALFMDFAVNSRDYGLLEDSKTESLGPAKDKKKWDPHAFENQILAYARKYDIELVGPSSALDTIDEADADVDLPVPESNTGKADPFGFAMALKKYIKDYGGATAFMAQNNKPLTPIGGDSLDITTWTSAKRKSKAFDKKDPLGKAELKALKEGMVMQLG